MNSELSQSKPSRKPLRLHRFFALFLILLGGFFGFLAFSGSASETPSPTPVCQTPAPQCVTTPIEAINRFDWVVGENPLGSTEGEDVEAIDYRQWRFIDTHYTKPDGTISEISLARPLTWLQKEQAEVGKQIHLDLSKLGIVGWADVVAIRPATDPGPRPSSRHNLVTAIFQHTAPQTIDLEIEDTPPIGCTPNHTFWSVDREEFIAAEYLETGERVQLVSGEPKRVLQKLPRPGPEIVYDLEVYGQHVYHVGNSGVLVHNSKAGRQRFPANPDDFTQQLGVQPKKISTTKHGTKRVVWEPNQNTRIRYESHPGDPGSFAPRHHGEHYHIEIKPGNLSWNQAKKQNAIMKVKPENYQPGHGTGFLPKEAHPGQ